MYEITHYKQPVFRAFAEEKFSPKLYQGSTFNREYASDLVVNAMGASGSYSVQGFTNTDETGVVNIKEESSIQIVEWQKLQDHLPTQMKYTTKAANALWLQVDAKVLSTMATGAGSTVDDAVINGSSGTSGNAVTVGPTNVQSLFTAAIQQLQLQSVDYDPNKTLAKDVKLEEISNALCAAISPQIYNYLLSYIGGKTTVLGDTISRNGHVGMFMGFNLFVSNNLMWEAQYTIPSANPADGDTITFLNGVTLGGNSQAITFTFNSTLSTTVPGSIHIASSAALTLVNLVASLNAPYTAVSSGTNVGFFPFVQSSLYPAQNKFLYNLSATAKSTNTIADIQVAGAGNVPVTHTSQSTAANTFVAGKFMQHNIFATSKSVSLLMQKVPHLFINPVSGAVARDFVTWNLYGIKVFQDQAPCIVDVQVDATNFGSGGTPDNLFL